MSLVLAPFPDVERAVCDLLAGLGTTGTEISVPDPQGALPYIRVHRTGGIRDRVTDDASVEISVFAADATQAKTVAGQVEARLISGPFAGHSFQTAHGQIDSARTVTGPATVPPTDSANLRQVTASYQVSARR